MIRRALGRVVAALGLLVTAPVLVAAAAAIRLTSPGPVWYRARRVGRFGRPFTMFKLRTMHHAPADAGPAITATADTRIFPVGAWLRRAKLDELPQLLNVLRGEMAIVGPRPEDAALVRRHYAPEHFETLRVAPGLTSPGSLYQLAHGDALLAAPDPVQAYVDRLLPTKLALDLVYVRRATWWYDCQIVARTVATMALVLLGRRRFADPPELAEARHEVVPARQPQTRREAARHVAVLSMAVVLLAGCRSEAPWQPGPSDGSEPIATLVGAGDIASCAYDDDAATALLLDSIPGVVFTAGDNAYPDGTADDFAACYGPTWGRHKDRTRPSAGNHEYYTPGAGGYFGYFGAAAGPPGAGYYSYELGAWHVIALNSAIEIGPGSTQLSWLQADLAGRRPLCALAYWHHPRFSSGATHGSAAWLQPVWEVLYDAGVDVVIVAHEHNYERFAPQTPAGSLDTLRGIRQFVVGTGGGPAHAFATPLPTSEVRHSGTPGVLTLTLRSDGYDWRFVPVAGGTFTDAGSDDCHDAPPSTAAQPGS
jgi:lipopolysaccharide/colanic/teichoic acid biosynthesis glycosyltransferase